MRIVRSFRILLLAMIVAAVPASSFAGVFVSVNIAPPPLPVYVQPVCPTPGYLWTPGYWAYGPVGYYWVPGVWVRPPAVGVLWTPGYWGWVNGAYLWHAGYWGPHVGFYGGVHYGFGYDGVGFVGGYWHGGEYFYNRSVVRVNETIIHNTYYERAPEFHGGARYSFNGPGGVEARATHEQEQAFHEARFEHTAEQVQHRELAAGNRGQLYSENHGQPAVAAREGVNGRAYNQQGRIDQGMRSGQLNAGQAGRDEAHQANIDRSIHQDRRANGGRLTPAERRNINRRQNRQSERIYNQRHR